MTNPIWKASPNFTRQASIAKKHITLHWMVGTLASTDAVFLRSGSGASAQYGIEGDTVHQYVAEKDYAWADGNTYSNRYGISIEHSGGWMLSNGTRFHPTAATHETSAQLCADISKRHGLGKLVVGQNLFPHNHWVATMCPGTLDIHWIAKRANEYLDGTTNKKETEHTMRVIFNKDNSDDDTRRAVVSDLVFKVVTAAQSTRERKLWGAPVNFTKGEWAAQLASVQENRAQLGLPPLPDVGGTTDLNPVLQAIEGVSGQVAGVAAQVAAFPPGASKSDVNSAADRVIESVPTSEQNGAAARDHIVRPV